MCIVPLAGLVWAAVGGPGGAEETAAGDETSEEAGAEADGEESASTGSSSKARKKKRKKTSSKASSRTGARKVAHEAAACCEALRTAGREEPDVSKRPTYLAAASACEAAPTEARALTQVKSIVAGSRLEVPSECQSSE